MNTKLEKSFEVTQSPNLVWEHLIDPEKVMDCVPGISIEEKVCDNRYKGKVDMKFGPIGVNYKADIVYDEIDFESRKITLSGKGVDTKGMGNAGLKMALDLTETAEGGSKVDAVMEVTISGKVAQFGSRLVNTVSNQLFKQFVTNFTKKLNEAEQG